MGCSVWGALYAAQCPMGNIGIHGTDKPWSISQAVSHGCVRCTVTMQRNFIILFPLEHRYIFIKAFIAGLGVFDYNVEYEDISNISTFTQTS
jgi:hypothetical protein